MEPPHLYHQHLPGIPCRGTIVVLYGTTKKKNFCKNLTSLADRLSRIGFNVLTFDYRSNLGEADIHDFGMYDRIEDAKQMIELAATLGTRTISLLGFGMGAHIAVRAAIEIENTIHVENLLLVSPTAYHHEASTATMRFGKQFNDMVNDKKRYPWQDSEVFSLLEQLCANVLVVKYKHDSATRRHVADMYDASSKKHKLTTNHDLVVMRGTHDGVMVRDRDVATIVKMLQSFLAGR